MRYSKKYTSLRHVYFLSSLLSSFIKREFSMRQNYGAEIITNSNNSNIKYSNKVNTCF